MFRIATILAFFLFLASCRKNISVPDQESEKLFGTWIWVQTAGGDPWRVSNPSTSGYDVTIEFDKNGIYKTFRNKKQTEKLQFTLTEGTSILFKTKTCFIKFKPTGILHKNPNYGDYSASFYGQDTLMLSDDSFDGFGSTYTRKK